MPRFLEAYSPKETKIGGVVEATIDGAQTSSSGSSSLSTNSGAQMLHGREGFLQGMVNGVKVAEMLFNSLR